MTTSSPLAEAAPDAPGAQHTAGEIAQQPRLWREVGATAADTRERTEAFLAPLLRRPELRVVLTGAGTSSFAGQVLTPVLSRQLARPVDAVPTTDLVANPRETFPGDQPTLLVSFARSGDSPESLAATRLAEQLLTECHHLVITCNPSGRLYRDHTGAERSLVLLMPAEANDQGFAMTSSFTCMVLAAHLALSREEPDAQLVERLAAAGERALASLAPQARELAAARHERVVYLGSGPLKALAQESALKLLELTAGRVVAYSDSSLGFRHGPKAVLQDATLVVVYLSGDAHTRRYDRDILSELRDALGPERVVAVTASGGGTDEDTGKGPAWRHEGLEGLDDAALALPFVLGAQLLGLHSSLALGLTPDNPFPGGEVNRVVQGVSIHPLPDRRG